MINSNNSSRLVSIIIVNWNGLRWLYDCFSSLTAQNYKNYEIIFVDNASKDGSVQWVRKNYPKTKILINKTNLGFSDANNVGYRIAKGKYILFLNNDTKVKKTFLSELVTVLESNPKIGGAQSKILLMDHPDTHDSVGAFLTPTGFLYHYGFGQKDSPKYDKQIYLYTAKGACMIFKKEVLSKVEIDGNIFDPNYFAYFEESDMCHRVWLAGYRIVYVYKSIILHKMGATSSSMNNSFVQYHSFKNRINSYIKNLSAVSLLKLLPLHISLCFGLALYLIFLGKYQLGFAIFKAFAWNIKHLGRTIRFRHFIQTKVRIIKDHEISMKIQRIVDARYYIAFAKLYKF
jgi:GT2 family glycosyltransferase